MTNNKEQWFWFLVRLSLGWTMFWAFFDKLFGLGFNTCRDAKTKIVEYMCEKAWLNGGSPTTGFLKFAVHGPLADLFHKLAGSSFVDWLFMLGLLLIGLAFILGILTRLAGYSGALMMALIYLALLPPDRNPFLNEHIVYLILFLGFAIIRPTSCCSLRQWWSNTALVKKYKILE